MARVYGDGRRNGAEKEEEEESPEIMVAY